MKNKKTIVLGVTGGIAAYKSANLASMLRKKGYDIHVIMTKNACNFITPNTFETLTNNNCITDQFERTGKYEVEHVALAKKADVMLIAPATANIIAKLAHGIADDALTTQALACKCPKIIAPAMNTAMFENPITQDNINILKKYGFIVIPPASGMLACRDVGVGKFPDEKVIVSYVDKELLREKNYIGKKVLVTAGATQESIDPVRYITNHSSGKMGYSIAREFMLRGADVTLVTAPTHLDDVPFVNMAHVTTTKDMFNSVCKESENSDIIIKAAAVSDYKPQETANEKIKKSDDELNIKLSHTQDILAYLGKNKKKNQFLCGFSMETQNMIENSKKKLTNKNLDMIVANNLKVQGAGFAVDTNVVTFITNENVCELPLLSKQDVAFKLAEEIIKKI